MVIRIRLTGIILLFLFFLSCEKKDPVDFPDIELMIDACFAETSDKTFDIITWNLREFPIRGVHTIRNVANIILSQNADLVALQEITGGSVFSQLLALLPGWEGYIDVSSDLNLAFLYKKTEVDAIGKPEALFKNEAYIFPRPPLLLSVRHIGGMEIFLINIHLKCCDGEENIYRRAVASRQIKAYIDDKLKNEAVIVIGDFNDEISLTDPLEKTFDNFLQDSLSYAFADLPVAEGSEKHWSYPSWPSHLDHILITDELFERKDTVLTLTYDQCDEGYFSYISDHRPLMIRLQ